MGGAFTSNLTWRWCFYINLPIGAVTAAGLLFLLKLPKHAKRASEGWFVVAKRMDPMGTSIFVPAIVCLLLALQWGGTMYPWHNGRIIALFVLFVVLLIGFIILQIILKDDATGKSRSCTLLIQPADCCSSTSNCHATNDYVCLLLWSVHWRLVLHTDLFHTHLVPSH